MEENLGEISIKWIQTVPDRIEASANLTDCGNLVFFGCYDGNLYFLDRKSGEIDWQFETGDAIKSVGSAVGDKSLVIFGSYDHFLYCLDYKVENE